MTRYLVPTFLVGFAAATVFANDAYGWMAAGVTVALMALVAKVRGTDRACAIPVQSASDEPASTDDGADADDLRRR